MEFQLSYFNSWKMMLWKCCIQYASKFGKLSSGHRTGKGQFSFQSQRKAMPKNAQNTTQLHSFLFSSVQLLSHIRLFVTTWTAAHQASLSITNSWSLLRLMSIESMIPGDALISHTSKVMLKILQARPQQYVNRDFQMFKLVLEKAEEPEIKLPTSTGSLKQQESSRKTSISALLTMPKSLTVWITINCGKFWKRWAYQTTWPASWEICMQVRKQQLELDMKPCPRAR